MTDISIIVFGMSHANALKRALGSFVTEDPRVRITVPLNGNAAFSGGLVVYDAAGEAMITPLLRRAVDQQKMRKDKPSVWVVSAMGGNEANRLSLFSHPEPFDFIDPAYPDDPPVPDATILPFSLIRTVMKQKLEWVRTALGLVKKLGVAGVVQLGPIPPMRHAAEIEGRLATQTIKAAKARGATDADLTIGPKQARQRMWRLEASVTREICERLDVCFLPPENALIGADGMRGADSAEDAIHGNEAWGVQVLRKIEQFVVSKESKDGQ